MISVTTLTFEVSMKPCSIDPKPVLSGIAGHRRPGCRGLQGQVAALGIETGLVGKDRKLKLPDRLRRGLALNCHLHLAGGIHRYPGRGGGDLQARLDRVSRRRSR